MVLKKIYCWLFFIFIFGIIQAQNEIKIVSLAPSITTNINEAGASDNLVGCTTYCPEEVTKGKEIIGSAVDINIEKIFSLQPDIVLTMQLTKPQDIESMKKLGLNVEVIKTPKNFDEICEQFLRIGRLIGREKSAMEVVEREQRSIDSVMLTCAGHSGQRVFFQIGANPVFTVLPNTFMDEFITMPGCINIASDLKIGTMTRESVLIRNPDVIIIATMGGFGADEIRNWKKLKEMSATKNNKIFLIDSNYACVPSPVNFRKSLEMICNFMTE